MINFRQTVIAIVDFLLPFKYSFKLKFYDFVVDTGGVSKFKRNKFKSGLLTFEQKHVYNWDWPSWKLIFCIKKKLDRRQGFC